MIDPLIQAVLGAALAVLFAAAAAHKLRSGARFAAQLAEYRLLPAAIAAAGLLAGYGLAIAINLARGRRYIDCGCGDTRQLLSPWLLVRNGLLAGGAILVALPAEARVAGWAEVVVGCVAFVVLVLTYLAAEKLLENASVLREWRESHG